MAALLQVSPRVWRGDACAAAAVSIATSASRRHFGVGWLGLWLLGFAFGRAAGLGFCRVTILCYRWPAAQALSPICAIWVASVLKPFDKWHAELVVEFRGSRGNTHSNEYGQTPRRPPTPLPAHHAGPRQ